MTLFVASLILFLLALFAFMTFLAMWVYKDAQAKSWQNPAIWVLCVLFLGVPGLIVYFAVGRERKDEPAPHKYTIPLVLSIITFIVAIAFFVFGTIYLSSGEWDFAGNTPWNSGIWVNRRINTRGSQWTERVGRGNGSSSRTLTLTTGQLQNFHIDSTFEEGEMFVRFLQDEITLTVDFSSGIMGLIEGADSTLPFLPARDMNISLEILAEADPVESGSFFRTVDLTYFGFEPGRVRVTLRYQNVRNSRTTLSW